MNRGMLPGAPMQRPTRRTSRLLTVLIVGIIGAGVIAGSYESSQAAELTQVAPTPVSDTSARAPVGTRIRIRVLNTTTTHGLARRASQRLRDFGYDVVDFDSDARARRSTTLILMHSGHSAWAQRLRKALGTGAIETRADSLHYVDFTVLIGSDWKAPPQAFRP